MTLELGLTAGILCGVALLLTRSLPARLRWPLRALLGAAVFAGLRLAHFEYERPLRQRAELPTDRPVEIPAQGYVTSKACRSCHPDDYHTWRQSYHSTMTQVASPETVLADFQDVTLEHNGRPLRAEQVGDELWVEMDDPDASAMGDFIGPPRIRRKVALTTGSHHAQAYWIPSGDSRVLDLFPMFHRVASNRWLPLDAVFLVPPDEHQLTDQARWNVGCHKCHATNARPGIQSGTQMDTIASEFGISCEACHGPAERHVDRHQNPLQRYAGHLGDAGDPTIVNPIDLDPVRASHVCAQCHALQDMHGPEAYARWMHEGLTYRPGDDLLETRVIVLDKPHKFWPDGMLRVSGREYNGLILSPCYSHLDASRGIMTCMSCHRLHKDPQDPRSDKEWANDLLGHRETGNHACTQCHVEYKDPAALTAHSHHRADSTGSSCYNCHMPHTAYGLMKAERSHQISNPDVLVQLNTRRPNACNLCHLDRTLRWTAEHLHDWYQAGSWTEIAEQARLGPRLEQDLARIASSIFWMLRGDASLRALHAWHMAWEPAQEASGTRWMAPFLAQLLNDSYTAVRFMADDALRTVPGYRDLTYDFTGPPGSRQESALQTLRHWQEKNLAEPLAENPALLLGPGGQLDSRTIQQLLAQQDQTRVYVTE